MGADDFNVTGSATEALFGSGDAVCVPVITWIADNYLTPLLNEINESLIAKKKELAAARQLADEFSKNQIAVESLESFISQNIEEISSFDNSNLKANFTELILLYNHRVHAVEIDKSLMIELPSNLTKEKNS